MNITIRIAFIALLWILLLFSAFFSGAETAYTSVSVAKINSYEKKGSRWAKLVNKHYKSFSWTLSTIILSNNIVNVGLSSLTTYLVTDLFDAGALVTLISILFVTPFIVVFGEVLPKLLARRHPIGYLKKVVHIMNFLNYLFFPFTFPLSKITPNPKITNTEKDLQSMLALARSEGVLEVNEATLAQKALELDSQKVRNVMTPKSAIVSAKASATIKSVKNLFSDSGFSRILVKDKNIYIGYLLLKDIIFADNRETIRKFVMPSTYVSQASLASNALEKMRINRCHIALVTTTSHSKTIIGIITIEDIMEELFGEIYDEHDPVEKIREIAHFKYILPGSTKMSELAKTIKFTFDETNSKTVKQWIQSRITRKIHKGLIYQYKSKITFKVITNKNNSETIIQVFKKVR